MQRRLGHDLPYSGTSSIPHREQWTATAAAAPQRYWASSRHAGAPSTRTTCSLTQQLCVVPCTCRQQRLATWISSIAELQKSRPAAAVAYSRPMPDVELLMQVCLPQQHPLQPTSQKGSSGVLLQLAPMLA